MLAVGAILGGVFTVPAHAAPTGVEGDGPVVAEPTASAEMETDSWVEVVDELRTPSGKLLSREVHTYGRGEEQVSLLGGGSGGTSSRSGCRNVWVNNREDSTFGTLLYTYKTSTEFCWNRSQKRVYNIDNDWDFIPDDMCWSWEGEVNETTDFYDWAGGWQSGYMHRRKGHVAGQCAFPNNKYPENTIRVHSDGTWTWTTAG